MSPYSVRNGEHFFALFVSDFILEKKNFHNTLQLVTLNAASYCVSYGYSGDSF